MESVQSEFYSIYEKSSDWLRLLARSEIRIKLLMILNEENMKLAQLRDYLNLTSSTILHAMKDMEDEELLENTDEGYALTNIGKIQALMISDLIKTITVLTKNKDFWLTHDISGIPDHLLKRLGDLSDCEVVKSTTTDLFKPHSNFIEILSESKSVKGVSPIYHPDYPKTIKNLLDNNASVQLIFNQEILDTFIESDKNLAEEISNKKNCGLWLFNKLSEAFTVTDRSLSIGLFNADGNYDYFNDLVGKSKESIAWGEGLFEHYLKQSKKIGL